MSSQESLIFGLLALVLALLVWGRWRYDYIAFAALVAAVALRVVPAEKAFEGFGHPATIVIALVLIVSRGLANAGVVDYLARLLRTDGRPVPIHIALMSLIATPLSAVMNNVAALALLMPIDIQAAARAKRPPGATLMALSFATILGGLITLIGTPPNIVVASFREKALGRGFAMFDFAPVGAPVAVCGLAFVALIGWRLIRSVPARASAHEKFDLADYVAEARIKAGSRLIGIGVVEAARELEERGAKLVTVVRGGARIAAQGQRLALAAADVLVLEAPAERIDALVGELSLEYRALERHDEALKDLALVEVVVPPEAWIVGQSAQRSGLLQVFPVSLVGVSRKGRRITEPLGRLRLKAGDILLLLVPESQRAELIEWSQCLPLASRGLVVGKRSMTLVAAAVFAVSIALAACGAMSLPAALALCVLAFVALRLVRPREVYTTVEWPVIVLLGSMIPLGAALEATGGTARIAHALTALTSGMPAWVALAVLMGVTMTLSDVLNNVATAVIAAPVGLAMAESLGVNPDPFLMAVAIASSCAFLTPIGHKNNILVLGPGGYRFGDYWRMGLPLEIIVLAVSLPLLLLVWPL